MPITIKNIHLGINNESKFKQAFSLICQFIDEQGWSGACHPSVAVLYAICRILNIDAVPCIGEAGMYHGAFDHSWLIINNKVFDAAIIFPLNDAYATGPIFNGFDLFEQKETTIRYGVSFSGLDGEARAIYNQNLNDYINAAPNNMLWNLITLITAEIGVKFSKKELEQELIKTHWKYIKDN
jgi:hypothetical protein